jgi:hypothetical protein
MKRRRRKPPPRHNPVLRAAIMGVLDNQLRGGDPPETRATYERLRRQGIDEEETRRLLACVLVAEIFDVLKNNSPYDHERFVGKLAMLPDTPWLDED